jgi:hypothetical protein
MKALGTYVNAAIYEENFWEVLEMNDKLKAF